MRYQRKPSWLHTRLLTGGQFNETARFIGLGGLHTICQSGLCPNRAECWRAGVASFMIGGDVCTRNCRFCGTSSGKPKPLDPREPSRVAATIARMKLRHAVVTSVDRDDLADGGAEHWAATIQAIRDQSPATRVEALIPDFMGCRDLIDLVLQAGPHIVGHNMETTRRLTPTVRSVATYERSLDVLRHVASRQIVCKTGFMVGLGETDQEVEQLMDDIALAGCSVLTIGQYLQPTPRHLPVVEYVTPDKFEHFKQMALSKGFSHVESAPLVRSSYHADRVALDPA